MLIKHQHKAVHSTIGVSRLLQQIDEQRACVADLFLQQHERGLRIVCTSQVELCVVLPLGNDLWLLSATCTGRPVTGYEIHICFIDVKYLCATYSGFKSTVSGLKTLNFSVIVSFEYWSFLTPDVDQARQDPPNSRGMHLESLDLEQYSGAQLRTPARTQ